METFVEKARNTREALRREGAEVLAASKKLGSVAKDEAAIWREYLRLRVAELGTEARRLPYRVEERVLGKAENVVGRVDEQLGERLRTLREGAPLPDYDTLSAKDIVAKIEELPADQVRAVYEFERAHKARATILRAAQQHLAA